MKTDARVYENTRKNLVESILTITRPLQHNVAQRGLCITEACLLVLLGGLYFSKEAVKRTIVGVLDGLKAP